MTAIAAPSITELTLPWPPSVNHYMQRSGRRMVKTAKAKTFIDEVTLIVRQSIDVMSRPIRGPLWMSLVARPPDRKERDLDNLLKMTLDAMQHGGLFVDDSQVCELQIRWGRLSSNGAIDVQLRRMEEAEIANRFWPGRNRRDKRAT